MIAPQPGSSIKFTNFRHEFPVEFCIIYDIETLAIRRNDKIIHKPIAVCSYTACVQNQYDSPAIVFSGDTCIEQFLEHLVCEEERIVDILDNFHSKLVYSEEDFESLQNATVCEVCHCVFGPNELKFKDHNHLNFSTVSNKRKILCRICNLVHGRQTSKKMTIPVIGHCSSKFDIHFVLRKLKNTESRPLKVLARNTESLISLRWGNHLNFVDSYSFLSASLDHLASLLQEESLTYYLTLLTDDRSLHPLLRRKAHLPYDFLDSKERLNDRELPSIDKFYNKLKKQSITTEQYEHAQLIWRAFRCKTMKDYLELYLRLDTILLAAIINQYRHTTMNHFGLDPMRYTTGPSLSFDSMLRVCDVQLEPLFDTKMYKFFSDGVRGGICTTSTRHAKANNDLSPSHFNPQLPVSHILAYDVNAMYASVMVGKLPTRHFRWMSDDELSHFDVDAIPLNGDNGYILEVDLQYPMNIHEKTNELPLAPERVKVPYSQWSPYTQRLAKTYFDRVPKTSSEKLMLTLSDKHHYILHHETLRLYLSLGMRLSKIHRGVTFVQENFMEKFITLNTEARKRSTSLFDTALYKFYSNAVFGKTCQNVFKQGQFMLVSRDDKLTKLIAKPNFKTAKKISNELTLVEMAPLKVRTSKAVYVGWAVLEQSKIFLYSFYYHYLHPKYYKSGLRLLYSDTDCLTIQVLNQPEYYNDVLHNMSEFDTSNYPPTHFLHSVANKRKLGLMKECFADSGHITHFIALQPKVYCPLVTPWYGDCDSIPFPKAKGIHSSITRHFTYQEYEDCLFARAPLKRHCSTHIRSKKHKVYTVDVVKNGLSAFDNKRYYLDCGVHSVGYGYLKGRYPTHCNICSSVMATETCL